MIPNFLDAVVNLDNQNNPLGIIRLIIDGSTNTKDASGIVAPLLIIGRIRAAFIIAKMLADHGYQDSATALALCIGGLIYGNQNEEVRGLKSLREQVDGMSARQQTAFYDQIITKTVLFSLLVPKLHQLTHNQQMQILEILKAAVPRLRSIFDFNAPEPILSLEEMRRRGREKACLLNYPLPPSGARQIRNVVLVAPEHHTSEGFKWLDTGKLIAMKETNVPQWMYGMHLYGWKTKSYGMKERLEDWTDACREIIETCRQMNADILLVDLDQFMDHKIIYSDTYDLRIRNKRIEAFGTMVNQLRQEKPSIKVAGYICDPWMRGHFILAKHMTDLFDAIIDFTSPSMPLWNQPHLANKVLHMILPQAGNIQPPEKPLIPHMLFAGSISLVSPQRALWLTVAKHLNLPIHIKHRSFMPDGLSVLDSYALYRQNLALATCCLNITMRYDMATIINGRPFEVILSGALLVQDCTPDLNYFLVSGEHYLEFSSVAELSAVMRFITHHREEAEEIRRCGHAFVTQHYNDEKIIGHLDWFLYFRK